MSTSSHIRESLRQATENRLSHLLDDCHRVSFCGGSRDETLELLVKERADSISDRLIVRFYFRDGSPEVHIPNILFPAPWRGNRTGMALIKDVHTCCQRYGYRLFVTHLTERFHLYLLGLGARPIDQDTVEIRSDTRLLSQSQAVNTYSEATPDPLEIEVAQLQEAFESGEWQKHRAVAFGQIEKGGVVHFKEGDEVVETFDCLKQIDDLWGWSD